MRSLLRIEAHRVIIVCTLLVESRRTTGPLANEDRPWLTLISRVDHFKGDDLWGETIFFDNASILKRIGAEIDIPPPSGFMKAGHIHARQHAAHWSRNGIRANPYLGASINSETLPR